MLLTDTAATKLTNFFMICPLFKLVSTERKFGFAIFRSFIFFSRVEIIFLNKDTID